MDKKDQVIEHKPQEGSVEAMITKAIENNVPVETMERLMAMRRELKAEFAREQYFKSLSDFQAKCPTIKKTKQGAKTNSGQVAYYYAPLDKIVEQTKELLQQNGFSYVIKTSTDEASVTAICIVNHINGHSDESAIQVPLGGRTGVMSNTQQVAAALTYAKRYAYCNSFGILTGDEDNDAQSQATPTKQLSGAHGLPVEQNKKFEKNTASKPVSNLGDSQSMIIKAMTQTKDPAKKKAINEKVQSSKKYSATFKSMIAGMVK